MSAPVRPERLSVAELLRQGGIDPASPFSLLQRVVSDATAVRRPQAQLPQAPSIGPAGPPTTVGADMTRRAERAQRIPEPFRSQGQAAAKAAELLGGRDAAKALGAVVRGTPSEGIVPGALTALAALPLVGPAGRGKKVQELVKRLNAERTGATLSAATLEPIQAGNRFAVGTTSKPLGKTLTVEGVERAIASTNRSNPNLGIWFDNGEWFAEATTLVDTFAEATRMGTKRKQRAIGQFINNEYHRDIRMPVARRLDDDALRALDFLPPEDQAQILGSWATAKNFTEGVRRLPSAGGIEAAARVGSTNREWYSRATKAFEAVRGPESKRYANVVAATSPNAAVDHNLKLADAVMQYWESQGRDLSRVTVEGLQEVLVNNGARFPKDTANNVLLALKHNEGPAPLKELKISAFAKNLLGDPSAVTLDSWMARLGAWRETKMSIPGVNLAYKSRVSEVAGKLGWTPDEVQAATWSYAKQQEERFSGTKASLLRSRREEKLGTTSGDVADLLGVDVGPRPAAVGGVDPAALKEIDRNIERSYTKIYDPNARVLMRTPEGGVLRDAQGKAVYGPARNLPPNLREQFGKISASSSTRSIQDLIWGLGGLGLFGTSQSPE